jgi:hypothetical protein
MAANSDCRVFSSAQTPVRPPEPREVGGSPLMEVVSVMTFAASAGSLS